MLLNSSKTMVNCSSSFDVFNICRGLLARQSRLLPLINSQPSIVSSNLRLESLCLLCVLVISSMPALAGMLDSSLSFGKVVVREFVWPNNKLDSFFHPQHKSAVHILSASGYLCGERQQLPSFMCESYRDGSVMYVIGGTQQ